MELAPNAFKAGLGSGQTQLGLWAGLDGLAATEICAGAGFDWMVLDAEHSPLDLRTLMGQLQAAAPYRTEVVVRPPVGDRATIKRLLDIGARTLLIPMVEGPAEAAALVAATRYAPEGTRGLSTQTRAARWGRVPDYLTTAGREICLLVQIETVAALDQAKAIASVEGVDGVFIGPADLAASMGHLGGATHPLVVERVLAAAATIIGVGTPVGILTSDAGLARRYIEAGFSFVAVGSDTATLATGTVALRARFDDVVVAKQ